MLSESSYVRKHSARIATSAEILNQNLRNGILLDLGCREGHMRSRINSDVVLWGIDYREYWCKSALRAKYERVELANLEEGIPLSNETVHSIYAGEILEHLLQTSEFLAEMYRVIKPGGMIHITTPNLAYLHNLVLIIRGRQLSKVEYEHSPDDMGHVSYYSPESLTMHLAKTGFTDIYLHPFINPLQHPVVRSIYRLSKTLRSKYSQFLFVTARKVSKD